jgi:hypothetical protein
MIDLILVVVGAVCILAIRLVAKNKFKHLTNDPDDRDGNFLKGIGVHDYMMDSSENSTGYKKAYVVLLAITIGCLLGIVLRMVLGSTSL